jgi:hypothetical protein
MVALVRDVVDDRREGTLADGEAAVLRMPADDAGRVNGVLMVDSM